MYPHLISGYDMVNEEEFTKEIKEFMPEILAAQEDKGSTTEDLACFFHAGETTIKLNTKRIGHGF